MRASSAFLLPLLLAGSAFAQEPEPEPPPAPEQATAAPAPEAEPSPAVEPARAAAELVVAAPSQTPAPPGVLAHPEERGGSDGEPWSLSLSWDQGYNAAGFDQGGEQSFNPEYAWGFRLGFGWDFEDSDFVFSWSQGLAVELTDSDSTVTRQELLLTDMTLGLAHPFEFELADDRRWTLSPRIALLAPISKASQAADVIVGTQLGATASYSYDAWLQGVTLSSNAGYTRRWASSNVASAQVPFPCLPAGAEASIDCVHLGSSTTSRDLFSIGVGVSAGITEELSAGLDVTFGWTLGHGLAEIEREIDSGSTLRFGDDETHLRTSRTITFNLGYAFLPWLSTSLFVNNGFSELGPDGERRTPFNAVDTVVGTAVTLSIDQLVLESRGDGPDDG
jgi:hypothetical protein